jgi:hypothetical protein
MKRPSAREPLAKVTPRSYYALSPESEKLVAEGKHPGCPRCGSPLRARVVETDG